MADPSFVSLNVVMHAHDIEREFEYNGMFI